MAVSLLHFTLYNLKLKKRLEKDQIHNNPTMVNGSTIIDSINYTLSAAFTGQNADLKPLRELDTALDLQI